MVLLFNIGFLEINTVDALDILLVTTLLYNLYKLIRGSVALRIFVGFLALYLLFLIVRATEMELLTAILGQFMGVGVIAALILFQQELRKFLLLIGRSTDIQDFKLFKIFTIGKVTSPSEINISHIIEAMKSLGSTKTGALIAVSKNDDLKFYADNGDAIDGVITKRLLLSIFFKNSPMHDGACIIHKGRIVAARCILPVSDNPNIPATLGLRHRAGIGLTEVSNTLVLLVSEETGQLSCAYNGKVYHNLSDREIRKALIDYMQGDSVSLTHK